MSKVILKCDTCKEVLYDKTLADDERFTDTLYVDEQRVRVVRPGGNRTFYCDDQCLLKALERH